MLALMRDPQVPIDRRLDDFIAVIGSVVLAAFTLVTANVAGHAREAGILVKNSIRCSTFNKMSDGTWYVGAPTTFRMGRFRKITFTELSIGPDFFTFGGADLYKVLESKCGAHSSAK